MTSLINKANEILTHFSAEAAWQKISNEILTPEIPFEFHLSLFSLCYPNWQEQPNTAAAWIPDTTTAAQTQLAKWMAELNISSVPKFHAWTVNHRSDFWQGIIKKLNIIFSKAPEKICDREDNAENTKWLISAKFNITDSCLNTSPKKTALIWQDADGQMQTLSYEALTHLVNRIANSLVQYGFTAGDAIAIDMPMNHYAVAIYLGIIRMGGVVVSIADSFSANEIATRLRIAKAKAIFTQDVIYRDKKTLPLYEKMVAAESPIAIVLPCNHALSCSLRPNDIAWDDFLVENTQFSSIPCAADADCNILFSSGTTGDPKAIPWTHTTAIKPASDAFLHHNIHEDDIVTWPTNLGWMMGPWLIFACLINHATIALYDDVPRDYAFGKFIQDAKVTVLGVVPTLVAYWRQSNCMKNLNWESIRAFSSTGECSNAEDMLYLMSLANYKPVIEYCGGTEIGGAYISSTLIENNYPAIFTTPVMGIDFVLLDGEVALIPPSIGLSTRLLNGDHHQIYFANMPLSENKILRRHGDQAQRFPQGGYSILGRVDDTMNLGGVKISSAEIERVLSGMDHIIETAAIAVSPPNNGPGRLVIYAATQATLNKEEIKKKMQQRINQHLNPLFKIHDLVFINTLPKTASNKIMRRVLRAEYVGANGVRPV